MAINKPIQVSYFLNPAIKKTLGEEALGTENLSFVDIGTKVYADLSTPPVFLNNLVYTVGYYVFANREYKGIAPDLKRESWEYGYLLSKVSFEMAESQDNPMYELRDGMSIDQNKFTQSKFEAKYFGKYVTFEVPLSVMDDQLKGAFKDETAMQGFIAGLMGYIDKSLTVREDKLILSTLSNMIGETIYADYAGTTTSLKSGRRAVNLFYLYKQANPDTDLTAVTCLTSADFWRFAAYKMGIDSARLSVMSESFNIDGKQRFTPKEDQRLVMLADCKAATDVFLQSDTFHNEFTALPTSTVLPYWQSPDTEWDKVDKVDVVTADGHSVAQTGVIACLFDRDAVGIINHEEWIATNPVQRAHFMNYWFQRKAGYFADKSENFLVYFVA